MTVKWSDGLLGSDNKTVTPRSQGALNAAFYDGTTTEFKNLQVTVSQTENVTHQAVAVTWTGGVPTPETGGGDYLQIMQCYGDAATGPDPENCEYGTPGLIPPNIYADGTTSRGGNVCPVGRTRLAAIRSRTDPGQVNPTDPTMYYVPFVPVGTDTEVYQHQRHRHADRLLRPFTTNEVQQAVTNADGTGQQNFQTLTGVQAPAWGAARSSRAPVRRGAAGW